LTCPEGAELAEDEPPEDEPPEDEPPEDEPPEDEPPEDGAGAERSWPREGVACLGAWSIGIAYSLPAGLPGSA
jgi:hypothetical protein